MLKTEFWWHQVESVLAGEGVNYYKYPTIAVDLLLHSRMAPAP